jgi:hypothetical protein
MEGRTRGQKEVWNTVIAILIQRVGFLRSASVDHKNTQIHKLYLHSLSINCVCFNSYTDRFDWPVCPRHSRSTDMCAHYRTGYTDVY